ncbi:Hypothetical predicted protein [Octopus vulgaris]|uniref:Uncharacterized protein n=1 Tax=Octopus vulgaris TaxID=6645 RepID=A0AA36AYI3_OCTVU|nr:Hypothetical predicted protein [Octopus vulgaris]
MKHNDEEKRKENSDREKRKGYDCLFGLVEREKVKAKVKSFKKCGISNAGTEDDLVYEVSDSSESDIDDPDGVNTENNSESDRRNDESSDFSGFADDCGEFSGFEDE